MLAYQTRNWYRGMRDLAGCLPSTYDERPVPEEEVVDAT